MISLLAQADANFCSQRENFYQKSKYTLEESLKRFDYQNIEIVFLAEPHLNFPADLYPEVADNLSTHGFNPDCYLLEADQNEKTEAVLERLNGLPKNEELEGLREVLFSNQYEVVMEMHKRGLKIYAVDNHKISDSDELLWMNSRDKHMANQIQNLLTAGKCKNIIYPIGSTHVASKENPERINLKEIISEQGLNSLSFNIDLLGRLESLPGETPGPGGVMRQITPLNSSWIPTSYGYELATISFANVDDFICRRNPSITPSPYAIFPVEDDVFEYSFGHKTAGKMSDFDLSISFSCRDEQCSQDNLNVQRTLKEKGLIFY